MPVLNLGEICSTATTFAGGRPWPLSEASLYANLALSELVNVIGHTPLEAIAVSSTTSGENRIALPTDYDTAISMTLYQGSTNTSSTATNSIPLAPRDAQWIDAQSLTGDSGGVPEAYIPYATWFSLWPSPNSAYSLQLRYFAKQPVLINSTETPALDERWMSGWLFKTVELLEASRNNVEGEAIARNRYLSFMNTIPRDQARKQKDKQGMHLRFMRNWPR